MAAPPFLSVDEKERIASAIKKAEGNTSAEIRVYFEKFCDEEVKHRAWKVFHQLKMQETQLHNGVLIYVAYKEKVFAIIGDSGIHQKVTEVFWKNTASVMRELFKEGKFAEGVIHAIVETGRHLQKHFPAPSKNLNELSDEVVIADE